jgi:Putative auto-transporter adhesin, head GIN domain
MKRIVFLASLSLFFFSSCRFLDQEQVNGDGNIVMQNRQAGDFAGVDAGGAVQVELTQDAAYSIKVEADSNLQEYIEISVENGILYIRQRNNTSMNPSRDVKVYISAPLFNKLFASGASSIVTKNRISSNDKIKLDASGASKIDADIKAPEVDADLSGASEVAVKGETKTVFVGCSGSSEVKAFDLLAETADVDLSGASHAEVYASVKLDAQASGASSIRYKGNAAVTSDVSGAGSIEKSN